MSTNETISKWYKEYKIAFIVALILVILDGIAYFWMFILRNYGQFDAFILGELFGSIFGLILAWLLIFGIGVLITKAYRHYIHKK